MRMVRRVCALEVLKMGFEDDPKDEIESYPCTCNYGDITFNPDTGCWECDSCDFATNGDDNDT